MRSSPFNGRRRWRRRLPSTAVSAVLAVFTVFALMIAPQLLAGLGAIRVPDALIVSSTVLAAFVADRAGVLRMIGHWLANWAAFERPQPIARPWVVDGDTIDDNATGVRYRLANIDAPETGENAKCFKEHERGEAAKREAIKLIRAAKSVTVRRTFRTDMFGRRVAFVLTDGVDLGGMLVKRGLARPWLGHRRRWCGKSGGLAKLAAAGAMPHNCATCQSWR